MLHRADREKEQGLGHGMEDDEHDRRPHGELTAHPGAHHNQAEIGDGGICQHALGVRLRHGDDGGDEEGHSTDAGNQVAGHGVVVDGGEFHQHEHAGLDHGAGMQEGRDRGGRNHGTQKPRTKRQLRRFGEPGEADEHRGHHRQRGTGFEQDIQFNGARRCGLLHQPEDGQGKGQATKGVQAQGAEGVAGGLFRARIADEQEGRQGGDFPAQEDPHQIIGQNDAEHAGKEKEEYEEEAAATVTHLGVMMVIILHVAEGIDADRRADDADDQHHDH